MLLNYSETSISFGIFALKFSLFNFAWVIALDIQPDLIVFIILKKNSLSCGYFYLLSLISGQN